MRRRTRIIIVITSLATAFVLLLFPLRYTDHWIDPVTGSEKLQTGWFYCLTTGPRYDVSPLETRLRQIGCPYTPSWQFLDRGHYTLLGHATVWDDGFAPPIMQLHPVIESFAESASPDELRKFADTMQNGTESQQKAAVKAACDKGLEAMAAGK